MEPGSIAMHLPIFTAITWHASLQVNKEPAMTHPLTKTDVLMLDSTPWVFCDDNV